MPRILVVGDDPLARGGLAALLAGESGMLVVAQIAAEDVARAISDELPDVAIVDMGQRPGALLDRIRDLEAARVPALALVATEDAGAEALSAGAHDVLFRETPAKRLAAAIGAVAAGLVALDDAIAQCLTRHRPSALEPLPESLTPRELEVLDLLASGLSNKASAERLGISDHTSKFHVNAILAKLGAQSRTEGVVRAARLGLVVL